MNERDLEFSVMLSTQRFLLEVLYANWFLHDAETFHRLMDTLVQKTRDAAIASEPPEHGDLIEFQARAATHLERFRAAVHGRISP